MEFLKEFWEFLKVRKKYWLLPIIIVLVLFGGLIMRFLGKDLLRINKNKLVSTYWVNREKQNTTMKKQF